MTHIAFCLPAYDGRADLTWVSSFYRTLNMLTKENIKFDFIAVGGCGLIQSARASLVAQALETEASIVLFIDGKQVWEPVGILRLIADLQEVEAVAAPAATAKGSFHCKYTGVEKNHLKEAEHTAIAFFGVRREVLEQMYDEYPELAYDGTIGHEGTHYDLFAPMIRNRTQVGEDLSFTIRMREAGIPLWVDEGIRVMRIVNA